MSDYEKELKRYQEKGPITDPQASPSPFEMRAIPISDCWHHPTNCKCVNPDTYADHVRVIEELTKCVQSVVDWVNVIENDQYEKLVHNQTLESAAENWNNLEHPALDIAPLKNALAESRKVLNDNTKETP